MSLVKTQNQIDAAAAPRASALLLYLRDARRAAAALVPTRHKRMLGVTWLNNGVFTRSSKRPAIQVYFEYICWKFAGRLLDHVNTL